MLARLVFLLFVIGFPHAQARPLIVTTTSIAKDLVQNVVGDLAEVKALLPNHLDPHDFNPRPKDIILLKNSILFVRLAPGIDDWSLQLNSSTKTPLVTLAPPQLGAETSLNLDPHFWLNTSLVEASAQKLLSELSPYFPKDQKLLAKNLEVLSQKLVALRTQTLSKMSLISGPRRKIAVTHHAFFWVEKELGVEFISPQVTPGRHDLSPKSLANFLKAIKSNKLTEIYEVAGHHSPLKENLLKKEGLQIRGSLYADVPFMKAGPQLDLLKMIEENHRAILDYLQK